MSTVHIKEQGKEDCKALILEALRNLFHGEKNALLQHFLRTFHWFRKVPYCVSTATPSPAHNTTNFKMIKKMINIKMLSIFGVTLVLYFVKILSGSKNLRLCMNNAIVMVYTSYFRIAFLHFMQQRIVNWPV
jgi:hypothetical protein